MNDNGMYWLDGFVPKVLQQGQSILTQGWGSYSILNQSITGFSTLSQIVSMTQYQHISDNQIAALSDAGSIFDFNSFLFNKLGKIHGVSISGNIFYCYLGGIMSTRKGNLLYSSANHLGVGWLSQATGGSSTTLIDTLKNFSDLGISSASGRNKVYNLTKGVEMTVTSVSTTTNANDTLNFSAATAPSAGDWYIVFCDDRFDLGTTLNANLHFNTQPVPIYWNRQIFLWNDTYYILNGNYLSALSTDETAWTADLFLVKWQGAYSGSVTYNINDVVSSSGTNYICIATTTGNTPPNASYWKVTTLTQIQILQNTIYISDRYKKQFPSNHQGLMASSNQDKVLIATYCQGKGSLLLWDGYSSGWLSNIELDVPASAMIKYGTGWIVLIGANLYITDGYNLTYLDRLPDSIFSDGITPRRYNMISTEDGFIISFAGRLTSRMASGNYVYNIKDMTWSYFPVQDKNSALNQTTVSLFAVNYYSNTFSQSTPKLFWSSSTEIGNVLKGAKKSSLIIYLKLPRKIGINLVELNISPKNDNNPSPNQNNVIRVNYGQGKYPFFNYLQPGAGSTVTLIKNTLGASSKTRLGQELMVSTGPNGYSRTYITNIANPGLATEELTIYPALPNAPSDSSVYIRRFDLYSAGSLTVNSDSFPENADFSFPSFYSDILFLEIVFENQDLFPLDLNYINIW